MSQDQRLDQEAAFEVYNATLDAAFQMVLTLQGRAQAFADQEYQEAVEKSALSAARHSTPPRRPPHRKATARDAIDLCVRALHEVLVGLTDETGEFYCTREDLREARQVVSARRAASGADDLVEVVALVIRSEEKGKGRKDVN